MREAVWEEDPTDPFVEVSEAIHDQWSVPTGNVAPSSAIGAGELLASQAVAAAQSLLALAEDQYQRAVWLLRQAGRDEAGAPIPGADADAERALLLRALAERRSALETGAFSQLLRRLGIRVGSDRKISEIIAFASEIRGRAAPKSSAG